MTEAMMIWLAILIVTIIIEVLTLGLTTIWFSGGALVAVIAAALGAPVFVQIILFLVVSLILLIFTRPIAVKYFNKQRVKTNVESLIGRRAVVISEINNLQGIGQVSVGGQEWGARSSEERKLIAAGTIVNIIAVSGVKLIVEVDPKMAETAPMPIGDIAEALLDPNNENF